MMPPRLPVFSPGQRTVILFVGFALLALYLAREYGGSLGDPAPAPVPTPVFVEVKGAASHPGVHVFAAPPDLLAVCRQAGAPVPRPVPAGTLASGTLVEFTAQGEYRLSRMGGSRLQTLGLAVDLNTAAFEDLVALPGVGPVLARRILEHRRRVGGFGKVEDLMAVPGIGEKKLEALRPHVLVGPAPEPDSPSPSP